MTTFTAWVTEMFTFRKNGYTVAMAFATKIVEIQWLPLTKIGFLMKRKQIFSKCVHITMDNLFSGDEVLRHLGEGGWKGTMTCRCDPLPKAVPKKYFNYINAAPVNTRSKVARLEKPIVAVKHVEQPDSKQPNSGTEKKSKNYIFCHVSFQSTGGTNISTVNALSSVELYVRDCSKGRGQQKRTWGIEMNEA